MWVGPRVARYRPKRQPQAKACKHICGGHFLTLCDIYAKQTGSLKFQHLFPAILLLFSKIYISFPAILLLFSRLFIMWMLLVRAACIPVFWLLVTVFVFSMALCRLNQTQRLYILPILVTASALTFKTSDKLCFVPGLCSLWSQSVLLFTLHAISLLYIEQWRCITTDSEQAGSSQTLISLGTSNLWATYKMFGNPRLILPEDSQASTRKMSRSLFVLLRVAKVLVYYVLHRLVLPPLFSEVVLGILPSDVSPLRYSVFRQDAPAVTAREMIIRAWVAVQWMWESLLVLDGSNAILSCLAVVSTLDQPHEWPPLFGDISSVTSVRRFWACFWHQLATRPYKSLGFVVARCMRLEAASRAFSFVVAFTVFAVSGLSHAAVSWQLGRKDWSLDMQWFLMNFLVCLVETLLLGALAAAAKRLGLQRELLIVEHSWLGRLVSGTWVFGFFFWTVPYWRYPRMHAEAQATVAFASMLSNARAV
jgi:hypothetical protein